MTDPTPEEVSTEVEVPTPEDYDFKAQPLQAADLPEGYSTEASVDTDGREAYARKRSDMPTYLRPDPPGTVRVHDPDGHEGFDMVTFPIMKSREIVKMGMDEIENEEGTLWTLREKINEAKFHLLKKIVADGNHMVSDLRASIVIEFECDTLTDKAKMITRVKPDVETVQLLLPNANFRVT